MQTGGFLFLRHPSVCYEFIRFRSEHVRTQDSISALFSQNLEPEQSSATLRDEYQLPVFSR